MKTVQPRAYMGTTSHSMWWSLVLAYQSTMRGSCNGRTIGMFSKAAMAEPWDGVGTTIRHKRWLWGGCDAHTGGESSVGTL
jgi:hypothetical protein